MQMPTYSLVITCISESQSAVSLTDTDLPVLFLALCFPL